MNLDLLGLQIDSPLAHPKAKNFRPPSWPPPSDWSPIVDAQGVPCCFYSDSSWPLDVWAGKPLKINFGDGHTKGARIDKANADLLRQCTVWFMWGPRGCRIAATLKDKHTTIKSLFTACSREGIVATELFRFDAAIDKIANSLPPSVFKYLITILHELLDAREHLGFCLLDKDGLARLAKLAPNYKYQQTPYIPPRIYTYQLSRLRTCLEDYAKHQAQIEDCFEFCLNAYSHNYGSIKNAVESNCRSEFSPFQNKKSTKKIKYEGSFKLTADRFGITELIERWVEPFTGNKGEKQITKLSKYLNVVSYAGLAYLINFSLMRIEEGWNLRSDCLVVENDKVFGDIYMLCGETTKTDPDADARWPVSKSVTFALGPMKHIAALRMRCTKERSDSAVTSEDEVNPYLISRQSEPWSQGKSKNKSYRIRPATGDYHKLLTAYPRLLDISQITINAEDMRIARLITPSLDLNEFKAGIPWRFSWHQLRRTGAVNMLSSEMVDESSLQLQLKHQYRMMGLYYGRNHPRLRLSEETRVMFLKTMYEEIGRDLRSLASPQFVSPLGQSRKEAIVTFINEAEVISLEKAARQGKVGARRINAGFCVNHRPCPYGGIESIAHCLGGDNGKPGCPDLLVNVNKETNIKLYEKVVDEQLNNVDPESPRHRSLKAEKQAIERFYEVIKTRDR